MDFYFILSWNIWRGQVEPCSGPHFEQPCCRVCESNMKHMLHACLPKGIVYTKVVGGCWTMQRKPQVALQLKVRLCVHWQLTGRKKWTSRQVDGDTYILCVSNKNLVGVGVKARLCRDQKCYAIWSWVKECPWHFLGSIKSNLAGDTACTCTPFLNLSV